MTADPYTRLDAAYLLGALDAGERLAYEAHPAICRRCRAGLAEISAIPPLLAGRDESVFAARNRHPGNETGPGESGKVAGVVDAMDSGKSAAVPLDLVNAGGAKIQPVKGAKRGAESPAQQDLYRGNVTYHQDRLAAVFPQQPVTGPVYPVCGVGEALAARRCLFGVAPPGCRGCGPSLLDFCQGEAIPVTEVGFTEIIIDDCGQAQFGGRNGSGVDSALQWRADHGVDRGTGG
jgi:hypothetical protein